jgi:uncharacterized membrane protein YgaE (UPF0421/DUF939 family)
MPTVARTPAVTRHALLRLRARLWPILQTAAAAVAAWYLAWALGLEDRPVFASIAAVISIGAAHGQRRERAVELIGGVVVGIGVADLLVHALGSGPLQIGVMVILAMGAAVLLGGGPLLVTEAGVSAILIVSLDPVAPGVSPIRFFEALAGGGVALAVSALVFPPDPALLVGRAAHAVFAQLGRTLEEVAEALDHRDHERAQAALESARRIDPDVRGLEEALATGRETARFAPLRRSTLDELDRCARMARHVDFAVRNTRVLARHVVRYLRAGSSPPPELAEAVRDLAAAVWALGTELDEPERSTEVRPLASQAAGRATAAAEHGRELALLEVVGQVRSTATDLLRASAVGGPGARDAGDPPTEELLVETLPGPG